MRQPFAFSEFHIGKSGQKGGIFRAAGIDAKGDFIFVF